MMPLLILFLREFHAARKFQQLTTIRSGRVMISTALVVLLYSYMHLSEPIVQQDASKRQLSTERNRLLCQEMNANIQASTQNFGTTRDTSILEGHMLMRVSDCYTCHADNKVVTAPSYVEISEKYKNDKTAPARLVNKIIEGGKGQWGDKPMNPHPELLREDAHKMIAYILHLRPKKDTVELPAKSQ